MKARYRYEWLDILAAWEPWRSQKMRIRMFEEPCYIYSSSTDSPERFNCRPMNLTYFDIPQILVLYRKHVFKSKIYSNKLQAVPRNIAVLFFWTHCRDVHIQRDLLVCKENQHTNGLCFRPGEWMSREVFLWSEGWGMLFSPDISLSCLGSSAGS